MFSKLAIFAAVVLAVPCGCFRLPEQTSEPEAATALNAEQGTVKHKAHHQTVSGYDHLLKDKHVAAKVAKAKAKVQAERKEEQKAEYAKEQAKKELQQARQATSVHHEAPKETLPSRKGAMRLNVIDSSNQGAQITVAKDAKVKVLIDAAMKQLHLDGKNAKFMHNGKVLREEDKVEETGLEDLDAIDVQVAV